MGRGPACSLARRNPRNGDAGMVRRSTTWSMPPVTKLLFPFQVWAAVGNHLYDVTKIQNLSLSSDFWDLCLGDYTSSRSFTGLVTAISRHITNIPHLAGNCSEALTESEGLDSYWKAMSSLPIIEMEEQQICSTHMHDITLHSAYGYTKFQKICSSLGGRLPRVEEATTNELDDSRCTTEDGFISWLHDDAVRVEGVWSQCPALQVNDTAGQRLCVADLPCSRCRVSSARRYYLYGPVEEFDREYSLKMLPDGLFYFEGHYTSNISRRNNEWELWSRLHSRWWRLKHNSWPLGRHLWYSVDLSATLTFTSCNSVQFPANDGTCLLRNQRCNGQQNHPDDSDEVGCRDRLIYKNPDYDATSKPAQGYDPVNVTSIVELIHIDKINAAHDNAKIEMVILLTWYDNRLRFVDVREGQNVFSCDKIWTPQLYVMSGYDFGPEANVSRIMKFCLIEVPGSSEMEVNKTDPFLGECSCNVRFLSPV